jgi:uncharacterized protein
MQVSYSDIWSQIFHNRVLASAVTGWAIAQFLKVALGIIRERRFNFKWFVGSGGMPSSHTALVVALAVSVGFDYGFKSTLFAVTCVFAFIIMFDAQGVRQQSGKQAEALNVILEDLYSQKGLQSDPLKELFGHTPIEVIAGAAIGVLVSLMYV